MIPTNKFLRFPRTLSFRILITLFFVSSVPLIIYGAYSMQYVEKSIQKVADRTSHVIGTRVIELYRSHLDSQAKLINLELRNIQQSVIATKNYAEIIYSHSEQYSRLEPISLRKEQLGYYWEKNSLAGISNTGISSNTTITPELLEQLSRSKYLEPTFQQYLTANQNIVAMYFILSNSAWRIAPAIDLKKEVEEKYFNPLIPINTYPFYTMALPKNNPTRSSVWSDPYLDITHRNRLLTVSAPVFGPDHQLIGVVGADMTLDILVENILNTKFNQPNAYAFLMSGNGKLIAVQEQGADDIAFLPQPHFLNTTGAEKSNFIYLDNKRILLTTYIPTAKWYLGYVISEDEMLSPIYEQANEHILQSGKTIITQLTITSIILIFLCLGMTIIMWSKITKPLNKLLAGIKDVSSGNFNVRVPHHEIFEINDLSQSFNLMSEEIDHLVKALDLRIKEKEKLQEELITLNHSLEWSVAERTEELRQTNQILLERNQQMKEIEHSRSTLFSNISHDLKTPLTLISGYVEAIRDGLISTQDIDVYMINIQQRIHSVKRLVSDLYELSLFDSKTQLLFLKPIELKLFLESVEKKWATHHGVQLNIQSELTILSDSDTIQLQIDLDYIHRAIDNLVENAQKYGPTNGIVLIEMYCSIESLFICVSDKGPGIAAEHLPFILNRTYRVDKSRNSKIPGNGLGLAIVQEIVSAHHGQILIDSELNKGSSFTIQIPINE